MEALAVDAVAGSVALTSKPIIRQAVREGFLDTVHGSVHELSKQLVHDVYSSPSPSKTIGLFWENNDALPEMYLNACDAVKTTLAQEFSTQEEAIKEENMQNKRIFEAELLTFKEDLTRQNSESAAFKSLCLEQGETL
ncbi:hypothetical protein GOP47_0030732 [Adiantum capillus-veneris]|nr:hypothetical protein GOP47_0030732 [Adiantum capillus-veneris]